MTPGPTPVNDNPLGCVRSVMFTGSIAVPRPGGEGCGLVVGSLSAVLGCGLVSLHPLWCWCVGFNLLPGLFLGTALGLSQ